MEGADAPTRIAVVLNLRPPLPVDLELMQNQLSMP